MSSGDWLMNTVMSEFMDLHWGGYPGWELETDGRPPRAFLEITCGRDRSSHEIAVEWDDLARGRFHWSDIPESGNIFVRPGDRYRSRFDFQTWAERDRFIARYGGTTE